MNIQIYRDYVVYAPSQWQTTLHCNVISHWPGACTEESLYSTHLIQSSTFVSITGRIDCYLNQWFKRYWCSAPPGALVLIGLDQYHHVLLVTLMRFVWCLWNKLGHDDLARTLGQLMQMWYIVAVICYQLQGYYQYISILILTRRMLIWKVITCDTPSHAGDHLYEIWKKSIQNCRHYRADMIFKVKAE